MDNGTRRWSNGSDVGDGGSEGARRASVEPPSPARAPERPEVEVAAKAQRRRFSAEYKQRVLAEAERCTGAGEIGALLRREGLYSSLLAKWREQRKKALDAGLSRKRGRKSTRNPLDARLAQLEKENARLRDELDKAHTIIEVQKKVARLLGEDEGK